AKPLERPLRILEIGCGAGANIPFFLAVKADYYAIEGSATVVGQLHERYPELKTRIVAGDFTKDIPFDGPFDVAVDRSSLTHNDTPSIRRCLKQVREKLKEGGLYIG